MSTDGQEQYEKFMAMLREAYLHKWRRKSSLRRDKKYGIS